MSNPVEHLGSAEQSLWGAGKELHAAAEECIDPDLMIRLAAIKDLVDTARQAVAGVHQQMSATAPHAPAPVPEDLDVDLEDLEVSNG